jgi:glycosyltransferase involved in cell wall biosynthesis
MTDETLVEIIMGTYNGARFLPAQIESLFAQTHPQWRLLARDDGSTDSTVAVLKAASDKDNRVHLVSDNLGNLGVNKNFSHLLALTTAPYVMCCDQDDVWLPRKIELTLDEMLLAERDHPGRPTLIHCDAIVTDSNLAIVQKRFIGLRGRRTGLSALLFANCVQGAATMINAPLREKVLRVQPVLPYDYHNALIAVATGQRRFIDKALLLYRQHPCNAIGIGSSDQSSLSARVTRTPDLAIDAFPHIQETLYFFGPELSPETLKELGDFSQLIYGENTLKRLFIVFRRRYAFDRWRDSLNLLLLDGLKLLLHICHVRKI